MVKVLSQSYGRPGNPGRVDVTYLTDLFKGCQLDITVGAPGKAVKGVRRLTLRLMMKNQTLLTEVELEGDERMSQL